MKEALKLALEALEKKAGSWGVGQEALNKAAITAIKEALAQPEQEPSITKTGCGILTLHSGFDDLPDNTKFYTTPPKRPWVGLTDEEISVLSKGHMTRNGFARNVLAKSKEKNA